MSDINQTTIAGRLTRDPIVRGQDDRKVTTLSLASNRQWQQNGEWQEEACFIDISVFGVQADKCAERLQKGAHVTVAGRLSLNRWQDAATGANRQAIRIVASNIDSPSFRANRPTEQAETLEQAALRAAAESAEAEPQKPSATTVPTLSSARQPASVAHPNG